MNEKLDEQLCKDFPALYRDRNAPMTETCLCWGFPGDGWHTLIRELSSSIEHILRNARSSAIYDYKKVHEIDYSTNLSPEILKELKVDEMAVTADQVKEKFGTLRFYWTGHNLSERHHGEIRGAVDFAEAMSAHICEHCGQSGETRGGGWIRTLCDRCEGDYKQKHGS